MVWRDSISTRSSTRRCWISAEVMAPRFLCSRVQTVITAMPTDQAGQGIFTNIDAAVVA